ncbi:MAG: BatA domain-containing protein [Candidatus Eisenbacteria bacterium]
MNFLNPLFLFGLAAAAIPILIHLFTRRRPREVRFSTLEFLAEVNQSEIRRLKLKQWLLLLLRTLAVAAIALAMSRPALPGGAGRRDEASTTLVALVDVSGSMGALAADAKPLTATARRVVESLLATMGPADEMLLIPYDRTPRPLSERPLADAGRLRSAALALAPSASTTDHIAALTLAARALGESRSLNREMFWVSDFQRAGFAVSGDASPSRYTAPSGPWDAVRVYLVPMIPRSRANAALTDAVLVPSESGVALQVTAEAFGTTPGDLAVEARAIGAPGTGSASLGRGFLSLGERGRAETLVPLSRLPENGGEVLLPGDALSLDDRHVFAAGRAGTLRVLLREDGAPSPLRLALAAGSPASGLDLRVVDAAALARDAGGVDAIVIGDVQRLGPAELQAVLDFHRSGGGLLLVPGTRADVDWWNTALLRELAAGSTLGPVDEAPLRGSWSLQRRVAGHAVLEGFPARPGEPLSSARFARARGFIAPSQARILLEFGPAHAALVEVDRTLVLATLLDPESSDFAVSGAFLPLLHQCAKVLGSGTAAASLVPGEVYRVPATTGEWRVEDEAGRAVPVSLDAKRGTTRLTTAPLEQPGLYRVYDGDRLRASFAVNPDPRESNLASLEEPALLAAFPPGRAKVLRTGEDLAARVREARYGRELWPWFVMAALVLLVAEMVIGRIGTSQRSRVGLEA